MSDFPYQFSHKNVECLTIIDSSNGGRPLCATDGENYKCPFLAYDSGLEQHACLKLQEPLEFSELDEDCDIIYYAPPECPVHMTTPGVDTEITTEQIKVGIPIRSDKDGVICNLALINDFKRQSFKCPFAAFDIDEDSAVCRFSDEFLEMTDSGALQCWRPDGGCPITEGAT